MGVVGEKQRLEQGWFEVRQPEPGVFTIEEPLHEERVKSYLVVGERRAVLIDTGMGIANIRTLVESLTPRPVTVVSSHAHWDHIGGNHLFDEVLVHAAEAAALNRGVRNEQLQAAFAPDRLSGPLPAAVDLATLTFPPRPPDGVLHGGERLDLGGRVLDVIHAPGHSPGGLVLLDRSAGALFSTDAAYQGALYCQFKDSDLAAYRRTMTMLADLSGSLRTVYPAHGESPIDPALLPRMAAALDAVARGRAPDHVDGGIATHTYQEFSVLVPAQPTPVAEA